MVLIKTKNIISLATIVIILYSTAFIRGFAGENDTELDDTLWETTTEKQGEFDGITPLLSKTPENVPVTQIAPAIVKIGHRYSVPQNSEKEKNKPSETDDIFDHIKGASIVSGGGTLLSLAVMAMIAMAGKALLLAFGALIITCLNASATETAGGAHDSSGSASTVYEVIAEPPHGLRGYTSEVVVRREPFAGTSSAGTGHVGGHRHR